MGTKVRSQAAAMLVPLTLLGACVSTPADWDTVARRTPAPVVVARGETAAVATIAADAADDPAIWRNAAAPAASLIVGTDKKAGLHVYDLQGAERAFLDAGLVNNVDLIETMIAGSPGILVVASDRSDPLAAHLALFRLDPARATLHRLARLAAGPGEAYGLCLAALSDGVDAFLVLKDGTIRQFTVDLGGAAPALRLRRTLRLATQSEGCAVDPINARLYVAEENVGLWRFDARPDGSATPVRIAAVDGRRLVADVEGVAVALDERGQGHLIVSSQGDNAYAVFALPDERFVGRFRIGAGRYGATSETDGIDVRLGDFGPDYPDGLFVAQDGDNAPNAQNFKLVDWRSIRATLEP